MEEMVISPYPDVAQVRAVELLDGFNVRIQFSDGTQRDINLEKYLRGPIFEPIRNDLALFRRIYIDHGALAWHNGADIDTDTLYYDGPPPWASAKPMRRAIRSSRKGKTRTRSARRQSSRTPRGASTLRKNKSA